MTNSNASNSEGEVDDQHQLAAHVSSESDAELAERFPMTAAFERAASNGGSYPAFGSYVNVKSRDDRCHTRNNNEIQVQTSVNGRPTSGSASRAHSPHNNNLELDVDADADGDSNGAGFVSALQSPARSMSP